MLCKICAFGVSYSQSWNYNCCRVVSCHNLCHCLSSLSPAEPDSVQCGRFGGGAVRQEEAVGSGGTGSYRERLQTGSRAQTLVPTGISELNISSL